MKSQRMCARSLGLVTAGLIVAVAPLTLAVADTDDELAACRSIEDDAERLACFDAVLSPGHAVTSKPPAGETALSPGKAETPAAAPAPAMPEPTAAGEPAADPQPAAAGRLPAKPEPAERQPALTDEVGRESIEEKDKEELNVQGHVSRCVEGRSGKYVFYFENGQVWRQRGSANVNWKECDFDVRISKDMFGYYLTRDGQSRKVRIERVR